MDQYFDWYDMTEDRRVRFAKMVLTGQAKLHWLSVEREIDRLGQPPITLWTEMKYKLKEKYLPPIFRDRLLAQLHSLHQGSLSVSEYMSRLDELMIRCDVREDPRMTITRFRLGLRPEIQKELHPYLIETLDQAFHCALEVEHRNKISLPRRLVPASDDSFNRRPTLGDRPNKSLENTSRPNVPVTQAQTSKDKSVGSSNAKDTTRVRCFKCHGLGHYAYECPRFLYVGDPIHLNEPEPEPDAMPHMPIEYDTDGGESGHHSGEPTVGN